MSVSEEAAAAFFELHSRLKSLEDTVQGSVESGTSGVLTRLTLIEELVSSSGTLMDARHDSVVLLGRRLAGDFPHLGSKYEEYEDWQYKVRIFLNSECSQFARFLAFLEILDQEIDMEDFQFSATPENLPGLPADVHLDEPEAPLKEHVMDTGCEVADITMANCLRRLVHPHLSADFQKMSHIVRCCDVESTSSTKLVCDCVSTKSAQRVSQMVSNQWTRASLSIVMTMRQERPMANDESDLHALEGKGKSKGFKGQCYHCGQCGHRVAECRKKDIDVMKAIGKTKGSAKERTHRSRCCMEHVKVAVWRWLDFVWIGSEDANQRGGSEHGGGFAV